jgi:hypothetical protein
MRHVGIQTRQPFLTGVCDGGEADSRQANAVLLVVNLQQSVHMLRLAAQVCTSMHLVA